eukprot:TRINITY_DN6932_c0_g2_i1.p1 TRINITY_DN6932_c0_g2~~TRINITY_DN6932_c0_g2_i1.p1  ORF type:complete len:460 (+),score=97.46 TRINITY_DN6932_c0_g2_i1:110-1489(+)
MTCPCRWFRRPDRVEAADAAPAANSIEAPGIQQGSELVRPRPSMAMSQERQQAPDADDHPSPSAFPGLANPPPPPKLFGSALRRAGHRVEAGDALAAPAANSINAPGIQQGSEVRLGPPMAMSQERPQDGPSVFTQKLRPPQFEKFLGDDILRLFDHWGIGGKLSQEGLGSVMCTYIINTDDVDFNCAVEFRNKEHMDTSFAEKLRHRVCLLASLEEYVIFEVKVGSDPLFRDEQHITQLISGGMFFDVFCVSCESASSGLEDDGQDSNAKELSKFNHNIIKAQGDAQKASKLAHDLRVLRWTVEEINVQQKLLRPYTRKDSEAAHQREISLQDALLNDMLHHPKVDGAWLTLDKFMDPLKEVECMYKAFLKDTAPNNPNFSNDYTVGQKITFGKEMLQEAKKKYQEELYVKGHKRLFKALSVVESERLAENKLLLNDVVLDVINGFPGYVSTIAAKLD